MRVEHEYRRGGSVNYIAALDINRAKIFGHCVSKTGIQPFNCLVHDVMAKKPYRSARRVFWIVDNGSSHRGQASVDRLRKTWSNVILVHLPIHASWLNQIEIYFSIIQRKLLTPNYFSSIEELIRTISDFHNEYEEIAKPFEWKFTKYDLSLLMKKIMQKPCQLAKSA